MVGNFVGNNFFALAFCVKLYIIHVSKVKSILQFNSYHD